MAQLEQPSWYKWSSSDYKAHERADAWQAALNRSHLSWNLSRVGNEGFTANLQVGRVKDLLLTSCVCQPCSGYRGSREIAQGVDTFYGLLFIYAGHEEVESGPRKALLGPGSSFLWDSTEPIRFKLHSPIHKATVFMPQNRLLAALPQAGNLVGKALDWRRGLGAVLASHVTALGSQIRHLDHSHAEPAAETILELIATSLGSRQTKAGDSNRAAMLDRIKKHIEKNLEDPELGPRSLAQGFGISLRYLHQLFTMEQVTASRYILERRLERCRRELLVSGPHKSVTEVALGWGFNDSAHFCRVFKKRYGQSPLKYRRQGGDPTQAGH